MMNSSYVPPMPNAAEAHQVQPPKQKPVKGKRRLLCIGIKYLEGKFVGPNTAQQTADGVAKFYERASRGKLQIEAKGMAPLELGLHGSKGAYAKGVEAVKKQHPGWDMYIIPGIYTGPHAGGKVAHVKGAQINPTATHEVGHLLGLGHAGKYVGGKLEAYGDTDSVMGRLSSATLTAPQYYHLGWLEPDEWTVFDGTKHDYSLRRIAAYEEGGFATVLVPPAIAGGRWAFVSCTQGEKGSAISLHLANGGGSQKVAEFGKDFVDDRFTGLSIKVTGRERGQMQVSITQPQELVERAAFAVNACAIEDVEGDETEEAA